MAFKPVIAVVPFGARSSDPRAGAWARQLARRLVDRVGAEAALDLRPVFLVAMPEGSAGEGHLILGSTPPPDLAAQYGASLGATRTLVGTYVEGPTGTRIDASLVDVTTKRVMSERSFAIAAGTLHGAERELVAWIAAAVAVSAPESTDPVANDDAYTALLEAMDQEVNATLLRTSDAARADDAVHAALDRYVDAAIADPESVLPEERVLVLAAESLERGSVRHEIHALERLVSARPRAWRVHYILGQLRAETDDANGAIVAFEHAHALHPLADPDLVRLAELYANAGAVSPGLAHLRRIRPTSAAYGSAQELVAIIAYQRGDLDAATQAFDRAIAAGTDSWELHASRAAAHHARGETEPAAAHYRDALAKGAPGVVRLNLARIELASGDRAEAQRDLDALLASERTGEVACHARRLRFGLRDAELERELEHAGQSALSGDATTLDAAQATFERALAIEPDLWEAHFGRGIVARQRGDADAARAAFTKVLELWPDQPDALHELGVALLESGDEVNAALRALDRAASLRPTDAAYLADAGFAHLRAGNLDTARRYLERASGIDANDPITKQYVGELLRIENEVGKQ
ncbi:MAG TPA: tetratricopeptide repeat protein [Candidatus Limnocylindria bacterium]